MAPGAVDSLPSASFILGIGLGMEMAAKEKKKQCFVVGPIGGDDSDDRIHADWLLEAIIQPVFEEHFPDFEVTRADKLSKPGQITTQVITALLDAELVIADLTTLNPNAFYEIGIRHTIQKPIIHMHLEGQSIPFDISAFRSIKFARRRPSDIKLACASLTEFVRDALSEDHEVDNPVTFSRGKVEFEKTATPSERIIQEQMEDVLGRLSAIEKSSSASAAFSSDAAKSLSKDWAQKFSINVVPKSSLKIIVTDPSNRPEKKMIQDIEWSAARYFNSISMSPSLEEDGVFVEVASSNENLPKIFEFMKDLNEHGYAAGFFTS